MPWDTKKCKWGYPDSFTNTDAANAVTNADFTQAVFVNTSEQKGETKQAYTYHGFDKYRICVVGHVHVDPYGKWTLAGNCFIPGWKWWDMTTPKAQVTAIGALPDGGAFPDDDRYPHPQK